MTTKSIIPHHFLSRNIRLVFEEACHRILQSRSEGSFEIVEVVLGYSK